ncbi:MAG: AtpZ/AtpI family protein [bacterium]|nr:AtpZ/AtpI family protein [bacterium]
MSDEPKIPWWQPGIILFAKLNGWIAFPVIAALFVGRWLDKKYNTEPWIFVACVGIAFVISLIGILKQSKEAMKMIAEKGKKRKEKESGNN